MAALKAFFSAGHTAQYLVAFALVAACGLALARAKIHGVGVAGVLFAGLACGRLGLAVGVWQLAALPLPVDATAYPLTMLLRVLTAQVLVFGLS